MAKNKEELKDEKKEEKKEEKKDRIAELEAEAKKLSDQIAEEKNSYLKLMAEFETFRRRTAEEKLALVGSASAETIKGLLPVLDDCERAMELLAQSSDEAAKEGTSLIYNKLMAYLKTRGLEKIEAKGTKFDTDFHEAVAQIPVPEEDKKGLVYDVVQTGYLLNGNVLRFAKVVVGI
ncbi:MAG: nucleotide exchange factor GrpE [Bacteroidales bacterium]|nr:nucleotide exchange factor GrpE [Bacteroidales bacterium]